MNFNLLNIGFGNMVMGEKVVAIISPESAPIKRLMQEARERNTLIDATFGRKTRSVLFMDTLGPAAGNHCPSYRACRRGCSGRH